MKTFTLAAPLSDPNCRPIDIIAYTFFAMFQSHLDEDTVNQYDQNLTKILRDSPQENQFNEMMGLSADFLTICNAKQMDNERERIAAAKANAAKANAQKNESEQTDHSENTGAKESDEDADNSVDMEDLFFSMIALMMGQRP